ncbi:MAG TPA: FAD-dependent oxidoreductase, partial [Gemmatimonadales bacterium]|nr:FAD-dependent oxidoreductase [Gemmatimonadales bacterium]
MTTHDVDVLVIGGGVVGLASALALAEAGRSVALLERHPRAGMETSTHNSGVI